MFELKTKKAFTLVELMIVIAIIGILAITIIPQLTGAQARARDTGRIQNVASSRAILETYFGDEGAFPKGDNSNTCLSGSGGSINHNEDLKALFSKGKAPIDPQVRNTSKPCNVGGIIGYRSLKKVGISDNSYLIVTDVEMKKKANTVLTDTESNLEEYSSLEPIIGKKSGISGASDAKTVVHAELY